MESDISQTGSGRGRSGDMETSTSGSTDTAKRAKTSIFCSEGPCSAFAPFLVLNEEQRTSDSTDATAGRSKGGEQQHQRYIQTWREVGNLKKRMPDSELLHTLHHYAIESYSDRNLLGAPNFTRDVQSKDDDKDRTRQDLHQAFDGSALVAIGVLVEELVKWEAGLLEADAEAQGTNQSLHVTAPMAREQLANLHARERQRRRNVTQRIRRDKARADKVAAKVETG